MSPRPRKKITADGFKKDFAERLKTLREKKEMTVQQLADVSGVSHATIHRWENGENSPVSEHLFAVAEALETSVSRLLK
jgi:transcriptional regulator with XRE-family HTH domain